MIYLGIFLAGVLTGIALIPAAIFLISAYERDMTGQEF